MKDTDNLKTSMKVQIEYEQYEYSIVIKGDINGDGNINSTDDLKLKKYFSGVIIRSISSIFFYAEYIGLSYIYLAQHFLFVFKGR